MHQHKDCTSNTSLKRINSNKYNQVKLTKSRPDMSKEYEFRPDGWRRRTLGRSA